MSIRILAFSTSTEICSVALVMDGGFLEYSEMAPRKHAEKILPMINHVLITAGITIKNIDVLAFLQGPGSFVGIRIGIGVAQGLALGLNLPLIGISSLATLAQGAWRRFKSFRVLTIISACADKFYFSYYKRQNNGRWINNDYEGLFSITEIHSILMKLKEKCVCVGSGWENNLKLFFENNPYIYLSKILYPLAQDMIPLVLQKWDDGLLFTPDEVQPIYLREKIV